MLANKHGLEPSQVLITNGSTEAFYLIASAFSRKKSLVLTPSFSEYEGACKVYNHKIDFLPVQQFAQFPELSQDLVWMGNPNNPDGTVSSVDSLKKVLSENSHTIFVVDEAYSGLCRNFESISGKLEDFDNLIVVKSLTKLFSIPGLRLGYLLTKEPIIEKIQHNLMPWNVNSLAIEAGKYILENEEDLLPDVPTILNQSLELQAKLAQNEMLEVIPSSCNYFLVKLKKGKAASLKEYLLREYGFLIRDACNFRGLNDHYFRIAVQHSSENRKLYNAINSWLKIQ